MGSPCTRGVAASDGIPRSTPGRGRFRSRPWTRRRGRPTAPCRIRVQPHGHAACAPGLECGDGIFFLQQKRMDQAQALLLARQGQKIFQPASGCESLQLAASHRRPFPLPLPQGQGTPLTSCDAPLSTGAATPPLKQNSPLPSSSTKQGTSAAGARGATGGEGRTRERQLVTPAMLAHSEVGQGRVDRVQSRRGTARSQATLPQVARTKEQTKRQQHDNRPTPWGMEVEFDTTALRPRGTLVTHVPVHYEVLYISIL